MNNFDFKEGILKTLSKKCPVNLHQAKIVHVSSSGTHPSSMRKAFDLLPTPGDGIWLSLNVPHCQIVFNFMTCKIFLKGYALRYPPLKSIPRMKSWVLQGSNDGIRWIIIDEIRLELQKLDVWETYSCISQNSYNYLRIIMTQPNFSNVYQISLSQIEFFGDIISEK